ncbi:MAG: response regulator [Firmicutes bacterium]|nr:response regulator [Bacillota bacterium]
MSTVLIIDDESGIRNVMRLVLQQHHITVVEAPSAQKGREQLLTASFDAILLDFRLPDMTGLQWLESTHDLSSAPVILISASAEIAHMTPQGRIVAILPKPFKLNHLWSVVKQVLEPPPSQETAP